MKKRSLSLLLALLLLTQLFCVGSPAAQAADNPTVTVGSVLGTAGKTVEVEIVLSDNTVGIAGMELSLTYPDGFQLTNIKQGSALSTLTYTKPGDLTANPVKLVWAGTDADKTNGVALTLTFTIPENATPGAKEISLAVAGDIYDQDLEAVTVSLVAGSITVKAAPLTSAAATVTAPARGQALASTVTCGSEAYTGEVTWYEGSTVSGAAVTGNAKASTVYTAQITLSPAEGQSFAESVSVTVNSDAAQSVSPSAGKLVVSKTFSATADKETPTCVAPAGLTATYGQKLSDLTLTNPDGNTAGSWAWKDASLPVGDVGTSTFKATFTPTDANEYATVTDIDVSVAVSPKNVTPTVSVEPAAYDYTGAAITPTTVTVKDGETVIPASEYTLTYASNTQAGTASVTVSDVEGGNYVLTQAQTTFTIRQASGTIEILDPATITYDGSAVECGGGKDINFTYTGDGTTTVKWYADASGSKGEEVAAPTDAGNYWIGVSATTGTNYQAVAEVTKKLTIAPKDISTAEVVLGGDPTYTGTEQTISITSVTGDGLTVTYSVASGEKGTNAGDYTLQLNGTGNFAGTVKKGWKILPASLTAATFSAIDAQAFTNKEITPKPTVTLNGKPLEEGTDFAYTYSANKYVGTATVNVSGKGNYTGEAATGATFTISAVEDPAVITATASVTKGGNKVDLSQNISGAVGVVSYAIKSGDGSVDAQGVFTSPAESGSAMVTISVAATDLNNDGTNEYTGKAVDVVVTIMDKTMADLTVGQKGCVYGETLPDPEYTQPTGVNQTTKTYAGTTRSGEAYTGAVAPTDAGTYTVKVVCETDTHIYEGTSPSFTIEPKPIDGAEVALDAALTYNTQSQTQGVSSVTLGGVDILSSCDVSGNAAISAGDHTLTVTAKTSSNYTGSVQKGYSISQKSIVPTVEGVVPVDYTGNQVKQDAVVVKDGDDALASTDYEIVYGENVTAGTDAGSLTVKAKAGGNYAFADKTVTFTINKIAYPGVTTMESETKYGTSRTIDLLPLMAEGYQGGTASVLSDADTVLDGTPTMTGTALTFAFVDDAEKTGKTATIKVPVTETTNYLPYDITVTVTVIDKLVQLDFRFPDDAKTVTYGDSLAYPAAGAVTGSKVAYESGDTAVATVDEAGKVTALKVGKTTITATASAAGDYAETSTSYVLTVDRATVTVKAMDRSVYVGGTAPDLSAPTKGTDYVVTGLVGDDELSGAVSMAYQLEGANVTPDTGSTGTYDIVISGISEPSGGNYNAIVLANGTLTIRTRPSSSGGSGSSGRNTSTTTEKHEDGSVTTTATDKKTGTVTETTKYPDGAKAVVTIEKDGKQSIAVTIPAEIVKGAQEAGEAALVRMPAVTPADSLENATPITITLPGTTPVKVELPIEEITAGTVAVIVKPDGTEEIVKRSMPKEAGIALTVDQGTTVKIVENSKKFDDVASSAWYSDNVAFVSSRELFQGTSSSMFSPSLDMSRGMLVTVLYRMENEPEATPAVFADVEDGQYYTEAVGWATEQGVVAGYGDGSFGPNDSITREQLAVMLWRYAGSPTAANKVLDFSDANKVSKYAQDALCWAVEQGIIYGKGKGILDPTNVATRAEVAAMLMRFCDVEFD